MQQKGEKKCLFYSNSFLKENKDHKKLNVNKTVLYPCLSRQIKTENYAPVLPELPKIDHDYILESTQKFVKFPGRLDIVFPLQTIPHISRKKANISSEGVPAEIIADRDRKVHGNINLKLLFRSHNIEKWMLLPFEVVNRLMISQPDPPPMFDRKSLFPLEWFDSVDFESMSPKDWLNLGDFQGQRYPIPGKAFIPKLRGVDELTTNYDDVTPLDLQDVPLPRGAIFEVVKDDLFSWRYVAVRNYDESTSRWIVTDLDNGVSYKIPRIYLMFMAEDPMDFIERVKNALRLRSQNENLMRYDLLIDILVMIKTAEMNSELFKKMLTLAKANLKFILNDEFVKDIKAEININYQRTQTSYEFRKVLRENPDLYPSVTFPEEMIPKLEVPPRYKGRQDFKETREFWRNINIMYIPEAIKAMTTVVSNCITLEEISLFTYTMGKSRSLADFLSAQTYHYKNTVKFLKGFWLENMAAQITMCLRMVGKGWLDINIKDWYVYEVSKIYRFIQQVRYRMQDSLHFFMMTSITAYSKYLRAPCKGTIGLTDSFVWETDLKTYPFSLSAPPIFYLTIHLSEERAYYSTTPEDFPLVLGKLLEDGCRKTDGIRQIDPTVMRKLVFANNLILPTVKLVRSLIDEHRAKIETTYEFAIIPLKTYACKYEEYIELYMTLPVDYVAEFAAANKSSLEVKEEIMLQKKLKENLQRVMPLNITIGPFFVNVDPLRTFLIERRKDIVRRLLEYFVNRMQKTTEGIIEQLENIMNKLTEKPVSIERLLELEEFMLTIPSLLEVLEDRVRITVLEYDILDFFFYNLSNEHFALKWEMIGYPFKIVKQIPTSYETHKVEIEEFKKLHMSEIINYEIRLEAINDEINNFSLQFDPNKAPELSVDAKKTWNTIKEVEKLGKLLQSRQEVFELPELSLDILDAYTGGFAPYKDLWITCADFLKLEELVYGNPLQILDMDDIMKNFNRMKDILNQSLVNFSEMAEIKAVVEFYLSKMEEVRPCFETIGYLKDENWMLTHWQELAKTAGIDLKYSVSINFLYCIKKGILDHLGLVKLIWERAVLEADEIRRAMEEEERLKKEEEMKFLAKRTQRKGRNDI